MYESSEWKLFIVAGDQDDWSNTVDEKNSNLRVYVALWKSVPKIGDIIGNGIITSGSHILIDGNEPKLGGRDISIP